MQDFEQNNGVETVERKSKLKLIVLVHFLIVAAFFVATFFWGNFA